MLHWKLGIKTLTFYFIILNINEKRAGYIYDVPIFYGSIIRPVALTSIVFGSCYEGKVQKVVIVPLTVVFVGVYITFLYVDWYYFLISCYHFWSSSAYFRVFRRELSTTGTMFFYSLLPSKYMTIVFDTVYLQRIR